MVENVHKYYFSFSSEFLVCVVLNVSRCYEDFLLFPPWLCEF